MLTKTALTRAVIPFIGLSFLAAAAILFVVRHDIYVITMKLVINIPWSHPFHDWKYYVAAISSWSLGVDVYSDMAFNYSPLWLRLTFIRLSNEWTSALGLSFGVLFFLSLTSLPPRRNAVFDFVILLLSTISSATALAVERANADLIIFLIIIAGVLACASGLPLRFVGYALITVAGLLKFYPTVALITAVRERVAIFVILALAVTAALGGLLLSYYDEIVRAAHNLPTGVPFDPNQFGANEVMRGLSVLTSKIAMKLFHLDATGAEAIGRLVHNSSLLLLIVVALAAAIWFGRHCRLQHIVAQLDAREASFLFTGAALICGCFFIGASVQYLYRGILLLLAVPGLLTLSHQSPSHWARAAFRSTCAAIVFVLWFPFVQVCIRFVVAGLSKPVQITDLINLTGGARTRLDFAVRGELWLIDQLAWWWIIIVLLATLGALVLNSELWTQLSRILPLARVPSRGSRLKLRAELKDTIEKLAQ
jgi:hypothetical protein